MRFLLVFALALASVVAQSGDIYAKDPNVYELTPSNFDKVVYNSNYTTVVKFYAPWCGYCKQLEPIYHKLARFMQSGSKYAVQVATVNCDQDFNKPLCSKHKVQGFPTLMVFRPPKFQRGKVKKARHVPEVYNGERSLAAMADFLTLRIKNYVKKFHGTGAPLNKWLSASSDEGLYKVVVFTKLSSISLLLRTLAIDFLDSTVFAAVAAKDLKFPATVEVDGETVEVPLTEDDELPALLVYKPEEKQFVRYKGKKLTNKDKIEKWIVEQTGAHPTEGDLSKKGARNAKIRGTKKAPAKDEL